MADLDVYKVDLNTPQPNGRLGETPRAAFSKYNDALDEIEGAVTNVETEISNLGTAATKDVTTSNIDGTIGRVLKVGDGGWMGGGVTISTPYGYPTSINDVTNQTKVIRSTVIDNGVDAYSPGIHFTASGGWGRVRVSQSAPRAWIQGGTAPSGAGWTSQLVLSDNILGTVSQSAGVPTGAIIERGSNANGEFVKFADGTLICSYTAADLGVAIGVGYLGGFRSQGIAWTFPAGFVTGSIARVIGIPHGSSGVSVATATTSPTSTTYFYTAVTSTSAEGRNATLTAIGRWY